MPTYTGEYVGWLVRAGDQLQSAMSRLGEATEDVELRYEARMARLEGLSAVDAWTKARRHHARSELEETLPPHLRHDAAPLAVCNRCQRKSWSSEELNQFCNMPQPGDFLCNGKMVPVIEVGT